MSSNFPSKLHIGLDLDGTIADHTEAKLALAREFGLELDLRETASEVLETKMPRERYRELQHRLYTEFAHHAQPTVHSLSVIPAISAAGHELSVVSRRKSDGHAQAREWLARYFGAHIPESRVFFVEHDAEKDIVCRAKEISVFLDDQLGVLSHLASVPRRFLFDPFFNFSATIPSDIMLVASWLEFHNHILNTHGNG